MKNLRYRATNVAALFLLLALSVVSYRCSKSDDTPAPAATVAGTWKISGLTANPAITIPAAPIPLSDLYSAILLTAPCFAQTTLTFTTGGTMTLAIPSGCTTFKESDVEALTGLSSKSKWEVNGSKITITASDGTTKKTFEYTLSSDTLTLTGPYTTSTLTLTLKKA
ncbi:MAG: lipocalin family protein [Sphingobacteriaceae bacterium]|nr:lipocalin family protein [Cytophagaceae bacterium]